MRSKFVKWLRFWLNNYLLTILNSIILEHSMQSVYRDWIAIDQLDDRNLIFSFLPIRIFDLIIDLNVISRWRDHISSWLSCCAKISWAQPIFCQKKYPFVHICKTIRHHCFRSIGTNRSPVKLVFCCCWRGQRLYVDFNNDLSLIERQFVAKKFLHQKFLPMKLLFRHEQTHFWCEINLKFLAICHF